MQATLLRYQPAQPVHELFRYLARLTISALRTHDPRALVLALDVLAMLAVRGLILRDRLDPPEVLR